jgi:hypothetical protein
MLSLIEADDWLSIVDMALLKVASVEPAKDSDAGPRAKASALCDYFDDICYFASCVKIKSSYSTFRQYFSSSSSSRRRRRLIPDESHSDDGTIRVVTLLAFILQYRNKSWNKGQGAKFSMRQNKLPFPILAQPN